MNTKLTALERLRKEKREIKVLYKEDEAKLQESWEYLSENFGSLFFHTALKGMKETMLPSLAPKKPLVKPIKKQSASGSTNRIQLVYENMMTFAPLVWDIVQPMLMRVAVRKIQSFFTSDKKEEKRKKK